jgi:hypothetical protein
MRRECCVVLHQGVRELTRPRRGRRARRAMLARQSVCFCVWLVLFESCTDSRCRSEQLDRR